MNNFVELLRRAKAGDQRCIEELIRMYSPLLFNEATVDGTFDEDLYQELVIVMLQCIKTFEPY